MGVRWCARLERSSTSLALWAHRQHTRTCTSASWASTMLSCFQVGDGDLLVGLLIRLRLPTYYGILEMTRIHRNTGTEAKSRGLNDLEWCARHDSNVLPFDS